MDSKFLGIIDMIKIRFSQRVYRLYCFICSDIPVDSSLHDFDNLLSFVLQDRIFLFLVSLESR